MIRIKKKDALSKPVNSYVQFMSLAFQMGIAIFLMHYLGQWIDRKYHVSWMNCSTVFTLFTVLGTTYSTIRQVKRVGEENDEWEKKNRSTNTNTRQ
jgi:hypothetical protein